MFWRERFLLKADDMSLLQVQLRVTEVDGDPTDPATEGFLSFVKPIYEPTLLNRVKDIFARDWTKIAIAKDIYRFASNAILKDNGADAVVVKQLESDQLKQIKVLLVELAKMFNPTIVKLISKKFDTQISKTGSDLTLLLRGFLQDTNQLGNLIAAPHQGRWRLAHRACSHRFRCANHSYQIRMLAGESRSVKDV
jgi:hypothetical protein